jgi:ferredoxin
MTALTLARGTNFQIEFMVFLISLLAAQYILAFVRVCTKKLRLHFVPRNKIAELKPYATLIESIRAAGFPHALVFSGRDRCYTFQFRIGKGFEGLPTASKQKIKILSRIAKTRTVRLA